MRRKIFCFMGFHSGNFCLLGLINHDESIDLRQIKGNRL
jgi:hypothetical protein